MGHNVGNTWLSEREPYLPTRPPTLMWFLLSLEKQYFSFESGRFILKLYVRLRQTVQPAINGMNFYLIFFCLEKRQR